MKKKHKTKEKKFKVIFERAEGISDEEAERRIFKALSMLVSEDDLYKRD